MSDLQLSDISAKVSGIDYAMLTTRAADGQISARPMSNNGDVEYDGDNYFFAFEDAHSIKDIEADPHVGLSFVGAKGLFGQKPVFIAIEATAELIRDRAAFREHWNKDIEEWATNGIDTPGLVLIKAHAHRIHYWDGRDEREVVLTPDRAM